MRDLRVTRGMLRRLGACRRQLDRFSAAFPEGADMSPKTVAVAHQAGLAVSWLARETSDPTLLDVLAKSEKRFVRVRVAENLHTSSETLAVLAEDPQEEVRALAKARQSCA